MPDAQESYVQHAHLVAAAPEGGAPCSQREAAAREPLQPQSFAGAPRHLGWTIAVADCSHRE